jgi:hypothetical protein
MSSVQALLEEDDVHTGAKAGKLTRVLNGVVNAMDGTEKLLNELTGAAKKFQSLADDTKHKMQAVNDGINFQQELDSQGIVTLMGILVDCDIKLTSQVAGIIKKHVSRAVPHFMSAANEGVFTPSEKEHVAAEYKLSCTDLSNCAKRLTELEVYMKNVIDARIIELERLRREEEEEQKDIGKQVQKHAQKVVDAVGEQGKRVFNFFRGTKGNFYSGGEEIYCCARCRKRISYL